MISEMTHFDRWQILVEYGTVYDTEFGGQHCDCLVFVRIFGKSCPVSVRSTGQGQDTAVVTSMLETKCIGDNYNMLVTTLITNTNYLFTLASDTSIQKMSSTSKFSHQHHCDRISSSYMPTALS